MSALLDALMGLGGGILDVLDMPGSYTRGALAGRFGDRLSGREMLEEWGMLDSNEEGLDFGDVAGFGADVLVDPLNLLGGGLLSKTARGRKHAKAMNLATDAERAAIDAANDVSMSMRAKGALPEEVAPQAIKAYRQNPTSHDVMQIPGELSRGNVNVFASDPNIIPQSREAIEFTSKNSPQILENEAGRVAEQMGLLRRSVDDQSSYIFPGDWPNKTGAEIGHLVRAANESRPSHYVYDLAYTDPEDIGNALGKLTGQIQRIPEVQRNVPIPGSVRNKPSALNLLHRKAIKASASPNQKFEQNTPLLVLADLLDETPGLERYGEVLRSSEQAKNSASDLARIMGENIRPARPSSQSFYALPNRPGQYAQMDNPALYGGDMAIEDFSRTYLPYIAPQIQPQYLDYMDVPRFSSPLLAALLGYNAANMVN